MALQRTCYIPFANLLLKTAIGVNRTGKPPLRCWFLLHSSLTPVPGQWDRRQRCKYTLGSTFVIIFQNFLIARHKSFGCATIARHNIKHVLWHVIAAHVTFYSQPGLLDIIQHLTAWSLSQSLQLTNWLNCRSQLANYQGCSLQLETCWAHIC